MIIITGASGLIGSAISALLRSKGYAVMCIDTREVVTPDIIRIDTHSDAMIDILLKQDITGIIHLAGVSRVIDAENNPDLCQRDNVESLKKFLMALSGKQIKPWLIFASSREVYGQSEIFPVAETAAIAPINVYGESKVAGEALCDEARQRGMRVLVVRFSSVYGWSHDHETRVVPAFVRHALMSQELCIEGSDNMFDFTHITDVTEGLYKAIQYVGSQKHIVPALHFVSGKGTTLAELAQMILDKVGTGYLKECPARNYDVHKFIGDPSLTLKELGWKTEIDINEGLERFIPKMRAHLKASS